MTIVEYVAAVQAIRQNIFVNLGLGLPGCEIEKRYILSGVQSDADWIASLVNPTTNKVRIMVMLLSEMPLGGLEGTMSGRNFNPTLTFNFELYHTYELGTDAVNSEDAFVEDCARFQYVMGAARSVGSQGVIERSSIRLGIRPSEAQPMHYGRGEAIVQLRDVRYEALA